MFELKQYQDKHQQRLVHIDEKLKGVTDEMERFRLNRKKGLGGSDMSALLGTSKYRTTHQVWLEKTGRSEGFKGNLATAFGQYAEDFVAQYYAAQTGYSVSEANTVICPEHPFLLANFDRLVLKDGKIIGGLECKTTGYNFPALDWKGRSRPKWGEQNVYANHELISSSDEIDPDYYGQVQFYLGVSGLDWWDVGVLISNHDLRFYRVFKDEQFISNMFRTAEIFWCKNVLDDIEPAQVYDDIININPTVKQIDANQELRDICAEYRLIKKQISELENKLTPVKNKIAFLMKNNEKAVYMGDKGKNKTLVTFRGSTKSTLDEESFKTKCPIAYKQYLNHFKTVTTSRILRVY